MPGNKRGPKPGAAAVAVAAAKRTNHAAETPRAQGATTKRTPTSAFEPAAGNDIYAPESVVASRLARGVTQYQVKWVGFATKDNTWEPIEHLAGCEDMMHGDLQKSSKDSTLEHSLFAAFNTD